jgi:hypothetical protein
MDVGHHIRNTGSLGRPSQPGRAVLRARRSVGLARYCFDEVPLVSNETLYPILQAKLSAIAAAVAAGDMVTASLILTDFELEVSDACITVSPASPAPVVGTGIANTPENPACCKLMADAEYVGFTTGIFQPSK